MQLFETLTFQYNTNVQFYQQELATLEKQLEIRHNQTKHEEEQLEMIRGIHDKVLSSLSSLLSIYRTLNLDILKCQCYLEKIPSTPELLFVESVCVCSLVWIWNYRFDGGHRGEITGAFSMRGHAESVNDHRGVSAGTQRVYPLAIGCFEAWEKRESKQTNAEYQVEWGDST